MSAEGFSGSERETEELGRKLARTLGVEEVVYLVGELGAGKTCFARGVALELGASAREVASPTFALLHEYAGPAGRVVLRHLDLYRLADDPGELEPLGLPDSVAGAPVLVEWPNRALRTVLPPHREVAIAFAGEGRRAIAVRPGDRAAAPSDTPPRRDR